MRLYALFIAGLLAIISACTSSSSSDAATDTASAPESTQQETTTTTTSVDEYATTPTAAAPTTQAQTKAVATWNANTIMASKVALTKEQMGRLCTNQYGCVQSSLYPLGWSEDGKFAYLREAANEAIEDLQLTLVIQDMASDEVLAEETFKASEQPDFREEKGAYTLATVWEQVWPGFEKALEQHNIQAGTDGELSTLPYSTDGELYDFRANNETKENMLFGIQVVDRHELVAVCPNVGQKRILNHQFGRYDLALETQALGVFRSPFEARVAVVNAWEKRGYEGPPNVLNFMLVGCKLDEGFE